MRFPVRLLPLAALLSSAIAGAQQYQAFVLQSPATVQNLAQAASAGHGAGTYYSFTSGPNPQLVRGAMYWPDLTGPATSLSPTGANYSFANAIFGSQVGGAVNSPATGGGDHAVLWFDGTPDHFVDLHPSSATANISAVLGMDGSTQVGYGALGTPGRAPSYHPFLWNGTASGAVDLMPNLPGVTHAVAASTAGGQQAGWAVFNDFLRPFFSFHSHAFLWTGTPDSGVDLHPTAFMFSVANGTDGNQQVGYGFDMSFAPHALLWTGTAASVVDLTPAGELGAEAFACRNGLQVGWVKDANGQHAAVWSGTAGSFVNLDAASSSGFTDSVATGIDENGNIVGYTNLGNFGSLAVMWAPPHATNHPPVAVAGPDQTVECQGSTTPVALDGSASHDPDPGDTLTYQWTDDGNNIVGSAAIVNLKLALGKHTFTLIVTDNHGAVSPPSVTHVNVVDTKPPVISGLSADPSAIRADDGEWVKVRVKYTLSDLGDPNPTALLSVSCSDAKDNDDAKVLDAHHVRVRAERSNPHKGRAYTITVKASDHSGNSTSQNVTVTVLAERHRR